MYSTVVWKLIGNIIEKCVELNAIFKNFRKISSFAVSESSIQLFKDPEYKGKFKINLKEQSK